MSGKLFLVATPIGNLEDVTLRALRVLREADLIAAEDTRRTSRLLTHHGISTRTVSFHEHNLRSRVPQLLARLREGGTVAVVSDAGMPGISDPGTELVQACVEEGIDVDVVPGANAHITVAVASGFPLDPLTLFGFAPNKPAARFAWLRNIEQIPHTAVFLEAPHRIRQTLAEAGVLLGERQIVVGRELTKVHQEFLRGTAAQLSGQLTHPKGEFTIVVGPRASAASDREPASESEILNVFGEMTNIASSGRRDAIAMTAAKLGLTKKQVYAAVERAKSLG